MKGILLMKNTPRTPMRSRYRIYLLCVLSVFLASCLDRILEKPSFVVREISLTPRSFSEMNLIIGVDVQNSNRLDLTLKSFEYNVILKQEEIGKGRLDRELLIPALSTARLQAPLIVRFNNLGGSLKTIVTGNDLPYKITGIAGIKTAFGSFDVPFSKEGLINLKF